jgi:hypothetical protein
LVGVGVGVGVEVGVAVGVGVGVKVGVRVGVTVGEGLGFVVPATAAFAAMVGSSIEDMMIRHRIRIAK